MEDFTHRFPSLKPFLVFECAARHGSFSAAAKAFNISQPSVSRNIAALEAEIGVALFERRATGAQLSDAGRELFLAVAQGLNTIQQSVTSIERRKVEDANTVTLSVSGSFVAHWMAPRLGAFAQAFPQVRLRFHLISGLMPGLPDDADLAMRTTDGPDPDHPSWTFSPEIVLPLCSPAYKVDHMSTGPRTILHLSDHTHCIWADMAALPRPGESGDVCHEFDDYSVILQAALDGGGIALGWLSVTSRLLLEGRLVPATGHVHHTGRQHSLIQCSRHPSREILPQIAQWLVAQMAADRAVLGSEFR
ncbi:LysR family transcriptional regulator [Donghicola mangrovi]|uniref:LysR family transcriptional regulator n=1 Tax=Donghicola mangrovi TaxID=2729614 RepID=A0A850Q2H3_9RHOB|nr:LysR family transcriptional regulator [Donghicola mangrovi]NVO23296.1 LysR family transcriptional regulator [Donghicola mangrovi]